ncbi:MAG: SsrA-binding protein SmpB [Acidobacteriota bacterium]
MKSDSKPTKRSLARNRRARHEYHIRETWEAGLQLTGTEAKAARTGKIQLKDSFVTVKNGEAFLVGVHISHYSHGNRENHETERPRKLLLHRREIDRIMGQTQNKGITVVPLEVYLKGPWVKVEIGLAQGKKMHDKRQAIRERELDREAREAMKTARGQSF